MVIPAVRTKVWLFHLKRCSLSTNILREICSYLLHLNSLAQVTPTFLRFFSRSAWEPQVLLRTRIQVDQGSAWVVLADGQLFCSGGCTSQAVIYSRALSMAYLLSSNGTVEQLPNMLTARRCHGVIQVRQIYVFGGGKL